MATMTEVQLQLQERALQLGEKPFQPSGASLLAMVDHAMEQARRSYDERADRFGVAAGMGEARANQPQLVMLRGKPTWVIR